MPVASAVTRDECDEGNPPLPTMSDALNRPVMAHALNGLSTCATTTAMSAATRPTLSPSVVPVPLKETCVISETDRRLARDVRAFQVAKVTRAPSLKRKPRGLRETASKYSSYGQIGTLLRFTTVYCRREYRKVSMKD